MNHDIDEEWITESPAALIKVKVPDSSGRHPWTDAEIKNFREFHQIGSPARIAFEVFFWTGVRCGDARRLGYQMIDTTGWIAFIQAKTNEKVTIPFTCKLPKRMYPFPADYSYLQENLKYCKSDAMLFILSALGKARSEKGISHWMSKMAKRPVCQTNVRPTVFENIGQ